MSAMSTALPPRPGAHVAIGGGIVAAGEARVSPFDRGLLFGDGVYETLRVVAGRILWLERHLARLRHSLAESRIPEPVQIAETLGELRRVERLENGSLFLMVTRGSGPRTHLPSPDLESGWLGLPNHHAHASLATRSLSAVTVPDWRWARCDIKTTSLMGTVLGKLRARDADADEVLFAGPAGALREGGSSTLFVRRADCLYTHPLDGHVLPGITRERVLRAAARCDLPLREEAPLLGERASWQEAFLCGTLTGIQPLVSLDGERIGDGAKQPAPWIRALAKRLGEEERHEIDRLL
jgi:D-alanine transaminase